MPSRNAVLSFSTARASCGLTHSSEFYRPLADPTTVRTFRTGACSSGGRKGQPKFGAPGRPSIGVNRTGPSPPHAGNPLSAHGTDPAANGFCDAALG